MKTLNGKEAFEAMMAGRNILCRATGEFTIFDDLDQFPATIFSKPGYEFCIKIETMELAGITFAKPLTLDDVQEEQEIFIVYPDNIVQTKYTTLSQKLYDCVKNGFAQSDKENAELQIQAIGKLFGREITHPLTIESHVKVKKKRSIKTKNEDHQNPGETDPVIDDDNVQNPTSNDVEKEPSESGIDKLKRLQEEAEKIVHQQKEPTQVIDVFSCNKRDQMIKHLNELDSVEKLERYAPCITSARSTMTAEDHQEVLTAYAARKEAILQQDLFGESA